VSPSVSPPFLPVRRQTAGGQLTVRALPFDEIARADWDRLLAATPAATPFARWSFHRAWWDAYGTTAHEQYLTFAADDAPDQIRAIVPLMHRHYVEPQDEGTRTVLRGHVPHGLALTGVDAECKTIFFAASYHADYATLLCAPTDLADVCAALGRHLAGPPDAEHGDAPWEAIDLRRLRSDDPALAALDNALTEQATLHGWRVVREQEDVCPVVEVDDPDWDAYLASLTKQARHEIRRKLRRAAAAGDLAVTVSAPDSGEVGRFIELHQARFGDEGLFPPTEGGARSRRFVERLAQLESAEAGGGQLVLAEVRSGERLIFAALAFDDGRTCYLYNAGMDPDARELSPGVTGTAEFLRERLAAGRWRFDFLRGDEPYKYEWGAHDEPIERLLVLRQPAEAAAA
jgi:hypothetical protein